MITHKFTPNPNCKFCHGLGETVDYHPYGSTVAAEYLLCDCVLEQLPDDYDDNDAIEIITPRIGKPEREFEYDDKFDDYLYGRIINDQT